MTEYHRPKRIASFGTEGYDALVSTLRTMMLIITDNDHGIRHSVVRLYATAAKAAKTAAS